jgi:hypothetical protein
MRTFWCGPHKVFTDLFVGVTEWDGSQDVVRVGHIDALLGEVSIHYADGTHCRTSIDWLRRAVIRPLAVPCYRGDWLVYGEEPETVSFPEGDVQVYRTGAFTGGFYPLASVFAACQQSLGASAGK